ncbi:hypothetical protein ACOME3_004712 [Neoechinorhynchus agilis]
MCSNCGQDGHFAFAKLCSEFRKYVIWTQQKHLDSAIKGTEWQHKRSSKTNLAAEVISNPVTVTHSLDTKMAEFTNNIMRMVDLRISTAIQHLESRLARHFDSLMMSINHSLRKADSLTMVDSQAPAERIRKNVARKPLISTPEMTTTDVEMDIKDNEKYVKNNISEQTKVCSEGLQDLINKGRAQKRARDCCDGTQVGE